MLNITKIFKFILNCIHFSGFPKHSFQSLRCFIHVSVSLSLVCWCHPTDRPTGYLTQILFVVYARTNQCTHGFRLVMWRCECESECGWKFVNINAFFLVMRAIIQGVSFRTPPMLISNSIYLIGENTSKWLLLLPLGDGYDLCESA